ncbi:hypothetical protein IQ216_09435 [Cyanobium sp. LEGE 06143]|uniref:hypothetical protein n=1 Tax=Cyanobium sp. LEGE 06143 TaxID=945727 RepID=UPI00187FC084|nr:hypothetical protein [Cyanobium sp. LEGE 06143]MBE9173292.1 hypothetical protein [Cyanobium sp. LEGE 06143]
MQPKKEPSAVRSGWRGRTADAPLHHASAIELRADTQQSSGFDDISQSGWEEGMEAVEADRYQRLIEDAREHGLQEAD